jgi:hypothetical protein
MMPKLKPLAKVTLALLAGLLLNEFAAPRWSSWKETIAAMAFAQGVCFLAALSLGGVIRGPGGLPAVIAFALSFLVWPVLRHGASALLGGRMGYLGYLGIFEVLPAIAGGLTGLALHRFHLSIWWFVATAAFAVSLVSIGPPRWSP